jgi:aminoglycoside 3-N-acetyltransferase
MIDRLVGELSEMGLRSGDHVLVRAALGNMTNLETGRANLLVRALLQVVGREGTILALTFNSSSLRPRTRPDNVFHAELPSITGGFAEAVRNWPHAKRSRHPLNSFCAFGSKASELLADHDETSACFAPMQRLMAINGKMLLVGCVASSPGFSTVHLAQLHLGLSTRTWLSGLGGILFRDASGQVREFRRTDIPGCSMGFSNFYGEYVRNEVLVAGRVGGAYSLSIKCRDAYEIESRLLAHDPRIALCADPACLSCRASLYYNKRDWFTFYIRNGASFLRQALRQLKGR